MKPIVTSGSSAVIVSDVTVDSTATRPEPLNRHASNARSSVSGGRTRSNRRQSRAPKHSLSSQLHPELTQRLYVPQNETSVIATTVEVLLPR